jgi:hypothetical protein
MIGSHALKRMQAKRKHVEQQEGGSTQTVSGGERVEFMVFPIGAADRVEYRMLCVCKVENGCSFTAKKKPNLRNLLSYDLS